jgi:hypothetical protein
MKSKLVWVSLCLSLGMFFLLSSSSFAAKEKTLIGEETLLFSLPSTQDRLISYLNEYYGKHHLIITFFPAAFTPL